MKCKYMFYVSSATCSTYRIHYSSAAHSTDSTPWTITIRGRNHTEAFVTFSGLFYWHYLFWLISPLDKMAAISVDDNFKRDFLNKNNVIPIRISSCHTLMRSYTRTAMFPFKSFLKKYRFAPCGIVIRPGRIWCNLPWQNTQSARAE